MGLRRRKCEPEQDRTVVALFTGQEVMTALYKAYPDRFDMVPTGATMWFSWVQGGMIVEAVS